MILVPEHTTYRIFNKHILSLYYSFLHVIINCSGSILLIKESIHMSGNILIRPWEVKIGW